VGTSGDDTVNWTASTLNAADSLDGGAGHDTLALFGSGTFNLSALAQFIGIEEVDVTNTSGGASNLVLRNGAITSSAAATAALRVLAVLFLIVALPFSATNQRHFSVPGLGGRICRSNLSGSYFCHQRSKPVFLPQSN
jgi:hypothetical protein